MRLAEYLTALPPPPPPPLLYNRVWKNEYTPSRWREGVAVNLFKKGDKTDPGNYRGITLLDIPKSSRSWHISGSWHRMCGKKAGSE
ncbi:unnamed protein product [Ectocarpus sp. CCAP 1310/34]|nr:unnamed protein product [Ectocarpus sp. CCAP 1310/34]